MKIEFKEEGGKFYVDHEPMLGLYSEVQRLDRKWAEKVTVLWLRWLHAREQGDTPAFRTMERLEAELERLGLIVNGNGDLGMLEPDHTPESFEFAERLTVRTKVDIGGILKEILAAEMENVQAEKEAPRRDG